MFDSGRQISPRYYCPSTTAKEYLLGPTCQSKQESIMVPSWNRRPQHFAPVPNNRQAKDILTSN